MNAGTGALTLNASHVELDVAKADAKAQGGKVGVGASVSLNIVVGSETRAEIENLVALSGGATVSITASSNRCIDTQAKAGSAEAGLLSAKFALADTAVWAPIDGIVANRKTRVGEYVAAGTHMLSIVPINDLWVEAKNGGHPQDDADFIIAATALQHQRVLVTGNTDHFSWISGLRLADWRKATS